MLNFSYSFIFNNVSLVLTTVVAFATLEKFLCIPKTVSSFAFATYDTQFLSSKLVMWQLQGTIEDIGIPIRCVFMNRIIQHIISLPVVKFSSSQEYCPADKRMTQHI